MSKKKTCGDLGGVTNKGTPCKHPSQDGERCWRHRDGALSVNKGGRPEHKPTDQTRRFVQTCSMGGIPQDEICAAIGINKNTLHKHYREEIDQSLPKATAKVVQTAFQLATSGKCPAMTMFWLKCRANWSQKAEIDITSGGEKLKGPVVYIPDNGRSKEE